RTPRFGLHLHENRLATHRVLVNCQLKSSADFGLLGYVVGKKIGNGVPFFHGIDLPADETARIVCLKALGAAMAASGAVALYHIEDFTPEAISYGERMIKQNAAVIEIQYLEDARIVLNQQGNQIDLVTLGCPHASLEELRVIAEMIGQRQLKKPLWIATSAIVREDARANGWLEIIERAGGKVLADTCMVVAPLEEMGIKYIATNSAKAATYLPSHQAAVVRYGTTEQCVQAAINGHF
ncbi:MAG: aconitase X catalytic domain-containing protein, partial [candidate division KSB1 bacterium]|nr:aconitase X catalytic domain-containing protein [candidate division KSB1 bacterium]